MCNEKIMEEQFLMELIGEYNKNVPSKKITRMTSCNHSIHYKCYLQLVHKYLTTGYIGKYVNFTCPLCKTVSNLFIPANFSKEAFEGVSNFLEKLLSADSKSHVLINDLKKNPDGFYNKLYSFFRNSLYMTDLNGIGFQIFIKDFVASLRLLISEDYSIGSFLMKRYQELVDLIFFKELNEVNINSDNFSKLFYNLMFLHLLVKDDIIGCLALFKKFKVILICQLYVKYIFIRNELKISKSEIINLINKNEFDAFIINNQEFIIKHVEIFTTKLYIIENINSDNPPTQSEYDNHLIQLNLPHLFSTFNDEDRSIAELMLSKYLNYINQEQRESILINPSLLILTPNISYSHISIPKNLLELSTSYHKIPCTNCNTTPVHSIICLSCGEKLCFTQICCKNLGKKKNQMEYMYHIKKCGGGDGMFLHLDNGQVSFSIMGLFIMPKIYIYQNKFGEPVHGTSISNEYVLNEERMKALWNEYVNSAYAKYFKIASRNVQQIDNIFI